MALIPGAHPAPLLDAVRQRTQLAAPDGGVEVAHPVVESDVLVFVPGNRLTRLRAQVAGPLDDRRVVAHDRAATSGGDHLVAVEREDGNLALAARVDTTARRPERFGGVLDERDLVGLADLRHPDTVGDRAVEVDADHRRGAFVDALAARQFFVEEIGIHVPGLGLTIDEARTGIEIGGGERRRSERESRREHVVARLDADRLQCEVQRRGAAREGGDLGRAREIGEFALERIDVGTGRRDPVRVEGGQQQLAFVGTHLGG